MCLHLHHLVMPRRIAALPLCGASDLARHFQASRRQRQRRTARRLVHRASRIRRIHGPLEHGAIRNPHGAIMRQLPAEAALAGPDIEITRVHGRAAQLAGVDVKPVAANRTRRHEGIARYHGHGTRNILVSIAMLAAPTVAIAGIVGLIEHARQHAAFQMRVAGVGILQVVAAGVIRRSIHFVVTQRHPAHARRVARIDVTSGARAYPGHERRRKHRAMPVTGTGHPAPAFVPMHPAAVVAGREAPGRIVYPGPAPGTDPAPVAETVRRPVQRHALRHPHRSVERIDHPVAVTVELFVTHDVTRHIARRTRIVLASIAALGPQVQAVGGAR